MLSLAGCIEGPGKREESESLTRQALALQRQHLDPDHPAITDSLFGLAQSALSQQRFEEAEALAREVVALDRKIFPKDHPSLITEVAFLCRVLTMRNKWQEAEAILNEAVQSSPSNSGYWTTLGEFNAERGNLTAAVDQFSRAVQLSPKEVMISWNWAAALLATGRIEEYRAHCHQFLERSANTQELLVAEVAAKAALLCRSMAQILIVRVNWPTLLPLVLNRNGLCHGSRTSKRWSSTVAGDSIPPSIGQNERQALPIAEEVRALGRKAGPWRWM